MDVSDYTAFYVTFRALGSLEESCILLHRHGEGTELTGEIKRLVRILEGLVIEQRALMHRRLNGTL